MTGFRSSVFLLLVGLAILSAPAFASEGAPRNYIPEMELSYVDPQSEERIHCGPECRRFSIPAGVRLEIRVRVTRTGGDPDDHGVPWDLWMDERMHPFPGIELSPCLDQATGGVDLECWRSLADRVDWPFWHSKVADRTCVPKVPGSCDDIVLQLDLDPKFQGSRGLGVYSLALWIDRFQSTIEVDEFDNFLGPVRVKVEPSENPVQNSPELVREAKETSLSQVYIPLSPKPYTVRHRSETKDTSFTLSSQRSRANLGFAPLFPGKVVVEVEQSGVYEKMIVEVRKLSTGEVLVEERGRGRLHLEGEITGSFLKDDRIFAVVVHPDQGARGARGSITVSYPAGVMYIPWDEGAGSAAH